MKVILQKLPRFDLPLPVVAILAAAVVVLPASQLAVLGLLRATQQSSDELGVWEGAAGAHESPRLNQVQSGTDARRGSLPQGARSDDALAAMASAVQRERRASDRLRKPESRESATIVARFTGHDAGFSAALSAVFAPTARLAGPTKEPVSDASGSAGAGEPFVVEFVALPLTAASALAPPFVLGTGASNGAAWAQIHPDLPTHASASVVRITLTRALGR